MKTFSSMTHEEKTAIRMKAAEYIRNSSEGRITIVAGHCSFPKLCDDNDRLSFVDVFSSGDAETYDTIFHWKKPAHKVHVQRTEDSSSGKRERLGLSESQLGTWIEHEENLLQNVCETNNIRFVSLPSNSNCDSLEAAIYEHCIQEKAKRARVASLAALDIAVKQVPEADTFLLLDGDRTLWDGDTGKLFFGESFALQKRIFRRYPEYAFQPFWESAMLFASQTQYEQRCLKLVSQLTLYSCWVDFLKNLPDNVHPILVTAGVREIWEGALDEAGFSESKNASSKTMSIFAGNHLGLHPYIIDPEAKKYIVMALRQRYPGCHVLAFGDSGKSLYLKSLESHSAETCSSTSDYVTQGSTF